MAKNRMPARQFLGITGNGETCAMISPNGAIHWFCIPRFDSPFVFGRLIDRKSGLFEIVPTGIHAADWRQEYRPASAVLDTTCTGPENEDLFTITDWMPWGKRELRRLITPERECVRVRMKILPTFDYRRAAHEWSSEIKDISGTECAVVTARAAGQSMSIFIPMEALAHTPEEISEKCSGDALTLDIKLDKPVEAAITYTDIPDGLPVPPEEPWEQSLDATLRYWSDWLDNGKYEGIYIEQFQRSLITMKLLTYAPTGAVLAAGTTSIPQRPGTGSNWDYRYSWVRDGAFNAFAYVEAGFPTEAKAFVDFLFSAMSTKAGEKPWQPLYRIDGNPDCSEQILEHLEGFHGDYPVRIGNLAYVQDQHDAEGAVLDALWDVYTNTCDAGFLEKHWEKTQIAANFVNGHWMETDNGIWELRGVIAHYTHSKAMCWIALDRAAGIAEVLGHADQAEKWRATADKIKEEVAVRGWNKKMRTFTFAYDIPMTDTSLLAIPLGGMFPADDRKVRSMVKRIESELVYGNLVARNIFETTPFLLTTFWLARYYILAGLPVKARAIVDSGLSTMTDLGLYCEQAVSPADVKGPEPAVVLRSAFDLFTAYDSFASFGKFVNQLYTYYTNRNTGADSKRTKANRVSKEDEKYFRGNFPQTYSHEELVRTLVRLGI